MGPIVRRIKGYIVLINCVTRGCSLLNIDAPFLFAWSGKVYCVSSMQLLYSLYICNFKPTPTPPVNGGVTDPP